MIVKPEARISFLIISTKPLSKASGLIMTSVRSGVDVCTLDLLSIVSNTLMQIYFNPTKLFLKSQGFLNLICEHPPRAVTARASVTKDERRRTTKSLTLKAKATH